MKEVKMPTSDSYHDYLIESLKDPEEAATYIEVVLEDGSDEPKLLSKVLDNIIEAYAKLNKVSESAKNYHDRLNQILQASSANEIYTFVSLLDALGFCIEIKTKENISNNQHL